MLFLQAASAKRLRDQDLREMDGGGIHNGDIYPVWEGDVMDFHSACIAVAYNRVTTRRLTKQQCKMCGTLLRFFDKIFHRDQHQSCQRFTIEATELDFHL